MAVSTDYKPSLDGVRAFCIILTISAHVKGTPWFINGTLGVDIFFALSGWLITFLLLREFERKGRVSLPAFYIRRFFRIVPLYFLTIFLYGLAAIAAAKILGREEEIANFLQGLPFFVTFTGEYMHHEDGLLFGHSWTLGIEEKFYLLWPLLLPFCLRGNKIAMGVLIGCVILLVSLASATELLLRGYAGLGVGALLAFLAVRHPASVSALWSATAQYGSLLGAAVVYGLSILYPHSFAWNILMAFMAAPFIGSLWLRETPTGVRKLLETKPLPFLGRLTYGVYLTHVLVINAMMIVLDKLHIEGGWAITFAACYCGSIALGWILHRIVELPLIDYGRRMARRAQAPEIQSA